MNNLYQMLGLEPGASSAEIKAAYRRLARKYHPDVSREADAEERFIEITAAYERLLEGPGYSSPVIDFSMDVPVVDHDELRRERARKHARMRYETFRRNNEAFQKAWYYKPVKWGTYLLIGMSYGLALGMFLAPLIAWLVVRDATTAGAMLIVSLFSIAIFKYTRDLQKEVKPYFSQ